MPAVSILVPVYNAEGFLPRCLDSILAQTMEYFELILIDDGSTDGSASIADQYALRDSRIRVIHQSNGGISKARNVGVASATGGDITFVDADDWIDPSYLAYLYQVRQETGCQIAACNHIIEVGGESYPRFPEREAMERLDIRTSLENILYHRAPDISPWGKLYPTGLLRAIRYPEGKIFEDTDTIADILAAADGIGMGFAPRYHYRYGEDTTSKTVALMHLWDFMDAVEHLTGKALELYPSLERGCVRRMVHAALSTKRLIIREGIKADYARANRVIRQGAFTVLLDVRAPRRDKLGIVSSFFGEKAYHALWRFYRRTRRTY